MQAQFHLKSSTLRLYSKQKDGGRGFASFRATVLDDSTKIQKYMRSRNPVRRRKKKRDHHGGNGPLHRMYHQQIEEVTEIAKTYQWLERLNRGIDHGNTRTGLEHQIN